MILKTHILPIKFMLHKKSKEKGEPCLILAGFEPNQDLT